MTTGVAGQAAEQQPPDMAGRGRGGPAGQLGERDRDGILDVVGEPAKPGAEDDPDLGDEVGARANGRLEGVEPGGLVGGRDRAGGVDRGSVTRVRASRSASRGETAEARGFVHPTDVPTPGCRSQSAGRSPAGRPRPSDRGQQSARSDRSELEALDVISVSPVPDGPFGQDHGTARGSDGSTRLSTNFGAGCAGVSTSYRPMWTPRG